MYKRLCNPLLSNSFFLFGARATGKTSLLKGLLPAGAKILWIDLLDQVLYQELLTHPERFVEMIPKDFGKNCWVVTDEIQRLPGLLNYVHKLIEERKIFFALTGSSARKLKRGGANLLAGRAFINTLHPLSYRELGKDFNLDFVLNWGSLPFVFQNQTHRHNPLALKEYLRAYVAGYLREEIKEEQIVRQLDPFARFLEVAAQHNGNIINASKIARDSLTDSAAVLRYFEILADTLLGFFLEPYNRSVRKVQTAKSKFYFFDVGVRRAIEGVLDSTVVSQSSTYGQSFEHFFILECKRLSQYLKKEDRLYYIRTKDDVEIDLLIERSRKELWAIEIKSSQRVDEKEFTRSIALAKDLKVSRFLVASREPRKRYLKDIEIWPWQEVLSELYGESD